MQNKQLEALKKDTEAQLHGICSMIEEFGKMAKEQETGQMARITEIEKGLKSLDTVLKDWKDKSKEE